VKVIADMAAPVREEGHDSGKYLPYIGRWSGGRPLRGSEHRHEVERCDYAPSFDYHESDGASSHHNREHYDCVECSLCEWRERMMNDLRESTWQSLLLAAQQSQGPGDYLF